MDLREILMALGRIDWAGLDVRQVGAWPVPLRAVLVATLFATAFAVGGWAVANGMGARIDALEAEEEALRRRLASSAAQAANLDRLRAQDETLEAVFADRRSRLSAPSETARLIEGITAAAEGNHLTIEGIEFADGQTLEHFAELPMSIRVSGSYHQLGAFAGSLANLPRILTLHDFEIEPGASPSDLRMRIDLKTYQPLEEP